MANIIPPLVSDSPPPPPSDDEDDDEFDDFRESNDLSYGCDSFSLTPSPEQSPKKIPKEVQGGKNKSNFNFDPVTSKSNILNSKEEGIQMIENEQSPHTDNESMVSSYSSKENQLSSSASSSISKSSGEESNDIVNKHNSVNKDLNMQIIEDIPSQLIFESKKLNEGNEFCDNSDNICETNQEVLNEDKNKDLNISNGFSVKDADSTRSWSTNFVKSENFESNLESELSVSSDNINFKSVNNCDKSSKNITDREDDYSNCLSSSTQSLTNETNMRLNVSNEDLKYEDSEDFSDAIHSKILNKDLVNDEDIKQISNTALDNENNNFDCENNKVENIVSSQIESQDEEFGRFIQHPISSDNIEQESINSFSENIKNNTHNENNGNNISQGVESSSNKLVNNIENKIEMFSDKNFVVYPKDIESNINDKETTANTEIEDDENFTDFINHSTETDVVNKLPNEISSTALDNKVEIESNENYMDFVSHPIETETNITKSLPCDVQTCSKVEIDSDDSFKDSVGTDFNIKSNDVVQLPSKPLEGDTEIEYDDFVAHSIDTAQTYTNIQNIKFRTENSKEFPKNIVAAVENNDEDDDFADFASFSPATTDTKEKETKSINETSKTTNQSNSNKPPVIVKAATTTKFTKNNKFLTAPAKNSKLETDDEDSSDDDFGDFTSFSTKRKPKKKQIKPKPKTNLDNEFWDFGDTSCSTEENQVFKPKRSTRLTKGPAVSEEEAFKRAQDAFKAMVLIPAVSLADDDDDFQYCELATSSKKESQDTTYYTTTPAYNFKWSSSDNQIESDSATTLPSYSWKPSLPNFSLKLDDQPLEPVKSSTAKSFTSTSSVSQTNSQSEAQTQPDPQLHPEPQLQREPQSQTELKPQSKPHTPSSQFDWIGSGLMSPVDYSPTDSSMPSSKPEVLKPDSPTDDHDDFASFHSSQSSDVSPVWPNIPLRETHISEFQQSHKIEVDINLQVTTVTEMPEKDISSEDVPSFNDLKMDAKDTDSVLDDDADFDDFQMSIPANKHSSEIKKEVNMEKSTVEHKAQPNKSILEVPTTENVKNIEPKELSDAFFGKNVPSKSSSTDFPKPNRSSIETVSPREINKTPSEHKNDDDDFTEFYSSAPLPQPQSTMLTPIMEPLKPTPVYTNVPSTQINWPDPGVTDDEIRRFEAAFATPLNKKIDEKPKSEGKAKKSNDVTRSGKGPSAQTKKPENRDTHSSPRTDFPLWDTSPVHKPHRTEKLESKKGKVKQNSIDEEEWSDFVSAQKPSPVNKIKHSNRNQTPSPDLTLSVLTLGSIQPTKQPIPVLTPQGIVQTKLSANKNPFTQQQKSNMVGHKPYVSPFPTTNQYASQVYSVGMTASQPYDFMQASQMSNSNPNKKTGQSFANRIASEQDDDEWGEFVSSPLPPQFQNSSTTTGSGWSKFVPNIRSAPVGSASNQSHFSGGNDKGLGNKGAKKKSSGVSGLVLPELKFLNLKDRSGGPKKK